MSDEHDEIMDEIKLLGGSEKMISFFDSFEEFKQQQKEELERLLLKNAPEIEKLRLLLESRREVSDLKIRLRNAEHRCETQNERIQELEKQNADLKNTLSTLRTEHHVLKLRLEAAGRGRYSE